MRTILCTGANGFLGKNIIKYLSLQDTSKFNILTPSSKELNLLNEKDIQNYFSKYKPNIILHAAAVCGGIIKNTKYPADFISDNLAMGVNIYRNCQNYAYTDKVYSLGSVCSYPVNCPTPFKEDDIWNGKPEISNFPYGESKRALLVLSQSYRAQYGLGGAFFIPVNLMGLFDHFDDSKSHVIPALIKRFYNAVKHNLPAVECYGSGDATREFLFAEDAAEVICNSILNNFSHNDPINLGTGKNISIKNLATLIAELTNFTGEIKFLNNGFDGQPNRVLDVSRAKNLLNWEAKTTLREALIKTIDWYKKELS